MLVNLILYYLDVRETSKAELESEIPLAVFNFWEGWLSWDLPRDARQFGSWNSPRDIGGANLNRFRGAKVDRDSSNWDGKWGRRNSPIDSGFCECWYSPSDVVGLIGTSVPRSFVSASVEGILRGWNSPIEILDCRDSPFLFSSWLDVQWTHVFWAVFKKTRLVKTNFTIVLQVK